MSEPLTPEPPYDISVVARLTGLSAANLRMWEKRYGVVAPKRSDSQRRLYSEEDVHRLTLLKNLSDRGVAIRKTSALAIHELEQLLLKTTEKDQSEQTANRKPVFGCRIVVVGEHLVETLRATETGLKNTLTVAEFRSLEAAETGDLPHEADLLLIECAALFPDIVGRAQRLIDQTNAVRAILVYSYARIQTVKALEDNLSRITAIRGPVLPQELEAACAADIALANRSAHQVLDAAPPAREAVNDDIPDRQFADLQLAKISQISSAIECECPHHLASLLSNLVGFERYSAECENRNEADARMHAYLHKMTAHARAVMEDALKVLVDFEGIQLES